MHIPSRTPILCVFQSGTSCEPGHHLSSLIFEEALKRERKKSAYPGRGEKRERQLSGERMAVDSTVSWNWGITWLTEKAFALKSIQNTASFSSSVPSPLLAQGEPCCCHGSPVVLPLLPESRLTGSGTAAVEGSSEGQGCRARGGCLRRCLSKQKMQALGKLREGPGGSALMRLWRVQRTC